MNRKQRRSMAKTADSGTKPGLALPESEHPTDPKLLYNLAVALEGGGRVDAAIEAYGQAIARKPDFAEAHTNLGIVLLEQGRGAEAIALLLVSRQLQPDNPGVPYNLAMALQQQGRLDEAVDAYRAALALKSAFPQAQTNLGIVLIALGRFAEAVDTFQAALVLRAEDARAHTNLGVALVKSGRAAEGIAAHRRAIAIAPLDAELHSNLGEALRIDSQLAEAIAAFRTALDLRPDYAEAENNLGLALKTLGQFDEAVAAYRAALRLKPDYAEALNNLGVVFQAQALPEKAAAAFRQALAAAPNFPDAYSNLGVALLACGLPEDSIQACARAVRINPRYAEALSNLGNAYYEQGRFGEAVAAVQSALDLRPNFPGAQNNLGIALQANRQLDQALAAYREALALRPDYPVARYNLATVLLLNGDYDEGWQEYEWRWKGGARTLQGRTFEAPLWNGEDLSGCTLLVHGEQGFGDILQFARYVPLLTARAAHVVFEIPPPLKRLLEARTDAAQVVTAGDMRPSVDYHLPLMSAPHLLKTALETIPARIPYVTADTALTTQWGKRLSRLVGLKVGLVWAGNPHPHDTAANAVDRRRRIALSQMTALLAVPGVSFVSLQKGPPAGQIKALPAELRPLHLMEDVVDFADTAALVANLDLVITVDTAVAHLAGAMGKPVWILSRFDGCWRWLTDRDDSPWYPTVRLFRQTAPGDWDAPLDHALRQLECLAAR